MTTMPVCPSCPNCAKPIEAAIRSQTTEPRNEKMIARYARGMMRDGTLDLHRPFRSTTPPPTTQPLRCPVGRPASPTPIDSGVDARSYLPCIHRAAKLDACHLPLAKPEPRARLADLERDLWRHPFLVDRSHCLGVRNAPGGVVFGHPSADRQRQRPKAAREFGDAARSRRGMPTASLTPIPYHLPS